MKVKSGIDGDAITSAPYGNTAMHLACRGLQKKAIEKLLLAKVSACSSNQIHGDTPLHILVKLYCQEEAQM